jgi:hypothetical protein
MVHVAVGYSDIIIDDSIDIVVLVLGISGGSSQ